MSKPVKVKKRGSSRHIDVRSVIDLEAVQVVKPRRCYRLSKLMAQFNPKHRHGEWDLGGAVGKEIW